MGEVSIEEMLEETRGVAVIVFELGPGDGDCRAIFGDQGYLISV